MAKRTLFSALLLAIFVNGVSAGTNLQIFYDFGSSGTACGNQRSNRVTTTIELFYPDPWGTTFAFVDFDYNINPIDPQNTPFMSYAEIARCLNFWQKTKAKDLSIQVEYNGGLGIFKDAVGDIRGYGINHAAHTSSPLATESRTRHRSNSRLYGVAMISARLRGCVSQDSWIFGASVSAAGSRSFCSPNRSYGIMSGGGSNARTSILAQRLNSVITSTGVLRVQDSCAIPV